MCSRRQAGCSRRWLRIWRAPTSAPASCGSCCSRSTAERCRWTWGWRRRAGTRHTSPSSSACASIAWAASLQPSSASRRQPSTCSPPRACPSGSSLLPSSTMPAHPKGSPVWSTGCSSAWVPAPCAASIPCRATSPSAPCVRLLPLPACGERAGVTCRKTRAAHLLPSLTPTLSPRLKGDGGKELHQPPARSFFWSGRSPPTSWRRCPTARRGSSAGAASCTRWRAPKGRSASRPSGGAARARKRATTTWWRTWPGGASGSSAPASTTAPTSTRNGSCTGCSRDHGTCHSGISRERNIRNPERTTGGAAPGSRLPALSRSGRDDTMTAFAELVAATNFSFLRGASHAHEMVSRAAELGLAAIGIADRNTLSGVVRAHTAAKEHGIRLLVGARLVTDDGFEAACYPTDRAAYGRLCRLLTAGNRRAVKGQCHFTFAELLEASAGQIFIVLPPRRLAGEFVERLDRLAAAAPGRVHLGATFAQ